VPEHARFAQMSLIVQASPSLHGEVFATLLQPDIGSQLSVVQTFPSSQPSGVPDRHVPS
jgi:hypothetical protein